MVRQITPDPAPEVTRAERSVMKDKYMLSDAIRSILEIVQRNADAKNASDVNESKMLASRAFGAAGMLRFLNVYHDIGILVDKETQCECVDYFQVEGIPLVMDCKVLYDTFQYASVKQKWNERGINVMPEEDDDEPDGDVVW